jgi:hypothetical protein
MGLREKLQHDIQYAMRARNDQRKAALRIVILSCNWLRLTPVPSMMSKLLHLSRRK